MKVQDTALVSTTQRVLLVAPGSEVRPVLEQALDYGPQLLVAADLSAAEPLIAQGVDLVLLDISAGDTTSLERLFRQQGLHDNDVPVLVLIAGGDPVTVRTALAQGAADCILGPLYPELIRAHLAVHLKLKKHVDMMRQLATLDPVTQLINRRLFERALGRYWGLLARRGTPVSLMLLSLDNFSAYTQQTGLRQSQYFLMRVARILDETLHRASDLACRYDTDKFAVLMPDTDLEHARQLANTLRPLLTEDVSSGRQEPGLTVAVVSTLPSMPKGCDCLLDKAGQLLELPDENWLRSCAF